MKFIPSSVFERINSMVQGVEAQGCLVTVRLEAYTCRHTKEEKQLALSITERREKQLIAHGGAGSSGVAAGGCVTISPILQPNPSAGGGLHQHGLFPPLEPLPPAVNYYPDAGGMGSAQHSSSDAYSESQQYAMMASPPTGNSGGGVDDRLVYLVAALNAIHGDGYDFSCLEEADFELLDPTYAKTEVENLLASLPPTVAAPVVGVAYQHDVFWGAIQQVIFETSSAAPAAQQPFPSTPSSGGDQLFQGACDFFLFKSPTCDPIAQRTVWSNHIFIYSKRQRVMVSLMLFGEGNMYRGDDGVYTHVHRAAGGVFGLPATTGYHAGGGGSAGSRLPRSESEEYYYDGETTHYLRASPGGLMGGGDEHSQSTAAGTAEEEWEVASGGETQKNRDFYGYS